MDNGNIQYVMGRSGAEAYHVYPDSTFLLMDSVVDRFYTVSCDRMGNRTIRTFEFREIVDEKPDYVTKNELKEILSEILAQRSGEHEYNKTTDNAANTRPDACEHVAVVPDESN